MADQNQNSMHPEAAALAEYWERERGDRVLPNVGSIDPLKMQRWIGDLSIVDLHEGPKRFYVRLHGGRTQERVGNDMTRSYFEDVFDPKILAFALAPYKASEKALRPTHSFMMPRASVSIFEKLERLVLPFSKDDSQPANVVSFIVWAGPTGRSHVTNGSVYELVSDGAMSEEQIAKAVQLEVLTT